MVEVVVMGPVCARDVSGGTKMGTGYVRKVM